MNRFLRNSIFSLIIIGLLVGTVHATGKARSGSLTIDSEVFDFGYVPIGFKLIHNFNVKNTGSQKIHIKKLIPNCDCSVALVDKKIIEPDSTARIKLIFDTEDYYGKTNRHISVYTDEGDEPSMLLKYTSNIGFMPRYHRLEPQSLFFLQGHKERDIQLINDAEEPVEFEVEFEPDSLFKVEPLAGNVDPKKPFKLTVSPLSGMTKGTHIGNFTVIYKTEPHLRITVPVKIVRFK